MANTCAEGIKLMKKTCEEIGLEYSYEGNDDCLTSLTIEGYTMTSMSCWDMSDYENLCDCLNAWSFLPYKELKKNLKEFIKVGWLELFGSYCKESYKRTHYKLTDLLTIAMKDCGYALEKYGDIKNKALTHEYKSTESAFIYKGYYITPCMLRNVINNVLRKLSICDLNKFYNLYYDGKKPQKDVIANDCLNDLFNNDNMERLQVLDDYNRHRTFTLDKIPQRLHF